MPIDILSRRLDEIDEAAITALAVGKIPESLELEYKQQLDLGPKEQRREAAKDVSAMANTVGGRLLYGVAEVGVADGSVVAGPIMPILDGTVVDTLTNLLATTIHPRPLFEIRKVEIVGGGFVLVVDVRPSPAELHMVTGYGDNRYYRRLPGSAVPMSEPEVREAYARVNAMRSSLESLELEALAPELERRSGAAESILVVPVVPLLARTALVNPGHLGPLRTDFEAAFAREGSLVQDVVYGLKTQADGMRARIPDERDSYLYLAVLKSGIIHWSFDGPFAARMNDKETLNLSTVRLIHRIVEVLDLAHRVYDRVGYHGPVRVHYVLRGGPFTIDLNPHAFNLHPDKAPAGVHRSGPAEAYLVQRGYARIAKALLDPIFHAAGQSHAPWFDDAGAARPELLKGMDKGMLDLLS